MLAFVNIFDNSGLRVIRILGMVSLNQALVACQQQLYQVFGSWVGNGLLQDFTTAGGGVGLFLDSAPITVDKLTA